MVVRITLCKASSDTEVETALSQRGVLSKELGTSQKMKQQCPFRVIFPDTAYGRPHLEACIVTLTCLRLPS